VTSNLYRDYWASTGNPPDKGPRAGFQTVWVQSQIARLRREYEALRAQHIKPTDIF